MRVAIRIKRGPGGGWHNALVASNGETVMHSEEYADKSNATREATKLAEAINADCYITNDGDNTPIQLHTRHELNTPQEFSTWQLFANYCRSCALSGESNPQTFDQFREYLAQKL